MYAAVDHRLRKKMAVFCFRGPEHSRRAWVIGTGLDIWELVELYEGKGGERLLEEHNVYGRQLGLARLTRGHTRGK